MNNAIQHVTVESVEVCGDTDNGATDIDGDGCIVYTDHPIYCGGYDDDDFVSTQMCCECGGGTSGNIPYIMCLHINIKTRLTLVQFVL
jgi:hypothetical protein